MGVSHLLSRTVTLTHAADCLSASAGHFGRLPDAGVAPVGCMANGFSEDASQLVWWRSKSGQVKTLLCPRWLNRLFAHSGCRRHNRMKLKQDRDSERGKEGKRSAPTMSSCI